MNKFITALVGIAFVMECILSLYHFFDISYLPAIYHMLIASLLFEVMNKSVFVSEIEGLFTKLKAELDAREAKAILLASKVIQPVETVQSPILPSSTTPSA